MTKQTCLLVVSVLLAAGCGDADLQEVVNNSNAQSQSESDLRRANASNRAVAYLAAHQDDSLSDNDHSFEVVDVVLDDDGSEHVRFRRRFKGMRVLGGDLVTHVDGLGAPRGTSHTMKNQIKPRALAAASAPASMAAARAQLKLATEESATSELVINAFEDVPTLSHFVTLSGTDAAGEYVSTSFLFDAATGTLQRTISNVHSDTGLGTGRANGAVTIYTTKKDGVFKMIDPTTYGQKIFSWTTGAVAQNASNTWNNSMQAVDASFVAHLTWAIYSSDFGRAGPANTGVVPPVYVNRNITNAYFDSVGFQVVLGDGDATNFYPLTSIDVVAHELTHSVTSATANLAYIGESGGLNEATSDIMGTYVEFAANHPADPGDFLIGEKVERKGGFLRNMGYPERDGTSAGCYSPTLGSLNVHDSSGVANHFFYLLSQGAVGDTHTCSTGLSFGGIGIRDAARIWYRALTVYMTSGTNYQAAVSATLQSAADLFGPRSRQAKITRLAWKAVKAPNAPASLDSIGSRANDVIDFTGDGKTEPTFYNSSKGSFSSYGVGEVFMGAAASIAAPGDFNGDGHTDFVTFADGIWRIKTSSGAVAQMATYGGAGDRPVFADYNGDGRAELAVYRPSTGYWYLSTGLAVPFGLANVDVPVPADYDGDGRADIAVYRPTDGTWFVKDKFNIQWGGPTGIPVPADYNGDGKTDLAIFYPSDGSWWIYGIGGPYYYGGGSDLPVPGDYNGDGKDDIAVYRPSTATWYISSVSAPLVLGSTPGMPVTLSRH